MPIATAASRNIWIDAHNTCDRVSNYRQQRIDDQRNDRSARANTANETAAESESKQSQTGNRLHDVGDAQHRTTQGFSAREQNTGGNLNRNRTKVEIRTSHKCCRSSELFGQFCFKN